MELRATHERAASFDKQDPLAGFRQRFYLPQPDLIYMDGNSLGRLPLATIDRVDEVVRAEWGQNLVRSWGDGWFEAPHRVGEKIARLVGAAPGQVVVGDSTSVNLFKLSMAALMLRPDRTKIVSDQPNFPSDQYVLQSCRRLLGDRHQIELLGEGDGIQVDLNAALDAIDENTALVLLSHVHFKSGFMYDAQAITRHCHQVGALVLWDLSHAVGAVPIELDQWEVDFAAGCTYKYLNGGPGAPAFLYVNQRLQSAAMSPIWAWFGQQAPFSFGPDYRPVEGVGRFMAGTPSIISLQAIEPGVDVLLEAGIEAIRQKSIKLTSFFIELFDERLSPLGFELGTPRDPARTRLARQFAPPRRLPDQPGLDRRHAGHSRFSRARPHPFWPGSDLHFLRGDLGSRRAHSPGGGGRTLQKIHRCPWNGHVSTKNR